MILYHGSNLNIKTIDLDKCRPYKDFGRGFYLTTLEEQAAQMARRVARIRDGCPCINVYEVPDDFMQHPELNTRDFGDTASQEWALFVMNNRNAGFRDYANIEYDEAMNRLYTSQTFEKLLDSETGLYLEGSAYVYGIYLDEMRDGTLENVAL